MKILISPIEFPSYQRVVRSRRFSIAFIEREHCFKCFIMPLNSLRNISCDWVCVETASPFHFVCLFSIADESLIILID